MEKAIEATSGTTRSMDKASVSMLTVVTMMVSLRMESIAALAYTTILVARDILAHGYKA